MFKYQSLPINKQEYDFFKAYELTALADVHLILFSDGVYKFIFLHFLSPISTLTGHYSWYKQNLILQLPHFGRKIHSNEGYSGLYQCNSPFLVDEMIFTEDQLFFLYQPATADSFYIDFYINRKYNFPIFFESIYIKCFRNDSIYFEQKGLFCDSVCRLAFAKNFKIDSFQISAAFGNFGDCEYVFKNTTFYFPKKQPSSISIFRIEEQNYYHNEIKWSKLYKITQRQLIKMYGLPTFSGDYEYWDNCILPPFWTWPVQKERKFYTLSANKDALITQHWNGHLDFARILVRQPIPTQQSELFEHPVKQFFRQDQSWLSPIDTTHCD